MESPGLQAEDGTGSHSAPRKQLSLQVSWALSAVKVTVKVPMESVTLLPVFFRPFSLFIINLLSGIFHLIFILSSRAGVVDKEARPTRTHIRRAHLCLRPTIPCIARRPFRKLDAADQVRHGDGRKKGGWEARETGG